MKLWGLASWQASIVMPGSQELNCKTFYGELNGCPISRFSGRRQIWLMNALGFFTPLILGVECVLHALDLPAFRFIGRKSFIARRCSRLTPSAALTKQASPLHRSSQALPHVGPPLPRQANGRSRSAPISTNQANRRRASTPGRLASSRYLAWPHSVRIQRATAGGMAGGTAVGVAGGMVGVMAR
jgi:hypothetical protein